MSPIECAAIDILEVKSTPVGTDEFGQIRSAPIFLEGALITAVVLCSNPYVGSKFDLKIDGRDCGLNGGM
jgi:hypothetical protein